MDVKTEDPVTNDDIPSEKIAIGDKPDPDSLGDDGDVASDQIGSSASKRIKLEDNNDSENGETKDEKPCEDPYAYTRQGQFTCEIYKMELGNLPGYISYTCLKKFVEKKSQAKPHKIKMIQSKGRRGKSFSFISFKSAEDRDRAIENLEGAEWKRQKLYAKKANPAKDPFVKTKMENETVTDSNEIDLDDPVAAGDRLNDKVCPLWRMPYEEQLKAKADNYSSFLVSLRKDITSLVDSAAEVEQPELNPIKWAVESGKHNEGRICPLEAIKPSPNTTGYRNKCEFSIGPGKIIGFRLGLYKEGSVAVVTPPENCPIVSAKIRNIVLTFQDYLMESEFSEYDNVTREGFWRQVTIRATQLGAMVIIAVHSKDVTEDRLEQEKLRIKDFFSQRKDQCEVSSIFFHPFITRDKTMHDSSELQLIDGLPYIFETMRQGSLTMKISPFAFFQTNSAAAEVCYSAIEELANLNESNVVLDICCGTGSIGIYLARKVRQVFGLELNHDALEDARHNAEANKITNIEFIEGKAETVIETVIKQALSMCGNSTDLIAIIDPPRAGLHPSVIKTLRATANIKKLVYVSCEPKLAQKNLIDLSRPKSNAYKGTPFVPTRAIPIDMFPHTSHCELLLLYQRIDTIETHQTVEQSIKPESDQ